MDGSLIYRKTRRGAGELAATHEGHVGGPTRRVLILLDGRRTVDELNELFGAEVVEHALTELEMQGFARLVDPDAVGTTTQQITTRSEYTTRSGETVQPLEPEVVTFDTRPRSNRLAWVALALTPLAIGAGYWIVAGGGSAADASRAAPVVRSDDSNSAPAVGNPDADAASGEAGAAPKELPLPGLPPVVVTKAGATVAAPVAETAPSGRRPAPDGAALADSAPALEAPARKVAAEAPLREAPQVKPREVAASAPPAAAPVVTADAGPERVSLRAPGAESVTPPVSAPATAPIQVAAVAPTPLPSAEITLRPRRHDPPNFPVRALRAGIDEGHVTAHISITPDGKVEQVEIVKAIPPRLFDDEVKRALATWTFDPPGQPVDRMIELTFKP